MRECPFCGSGNRQRFGSRLGAEFIRCRSCRSIYRDITIEEFDRVHEDAFEEGDFLERILAGYGREPDVKAWDRLALPGSSVLEIGPGAGHLLAGAAARQRTVFAVETSARHREFLRESWGIERLFASMASLPTDLRVETIVAINVLEHVYDIGPFLASIREHLVPGGVAFLSTPNAEALVCSLMRTMWSMFKQPDHVSFPSRVGLRTAASKASLVGDRIWSGEMAFETPVGLGVAGRDLWKERHAVEVGTAQVVGPSGAPRAPATTGRGSRALADLNRSRAARYEPTSVVLARLGRAGTVKAVLRRR